MNGIVGMIQLIKNNNKIKDQKMYINSLDEASSHLQLLINDLLDLVRLNNKTLKINFEYFDITNSIKNIIEYFKTQVKKDIKFEYIIDKNLRLFYGDKKRINQILNNLLSNSLKYTEKGKISVKLFIEKNNLNLIVADTGKGIKKNQIKNIFNEFDQFEKNQKYSIHGLGLGLSIVKQLVTSMKGKINIKSTPGKGTKFTITFPYINKEEIKEKMRKIIKKDNKIKNTKKTVNILLAEDDFISRIYVERIIQRQSWKIKSVENGKDVLLELKNNSFDLILMDINMPILNGLETTEKIRKLNNSKRNIPIIAVTGHAFDEDKEKFLEIGINDLIIKPYTEKQLIDKIISFLTIQI